MNNYESENTTNGSRNYETRRLLLWLLNTEYLYLTMREIALSAEDQFDAAQSVRDLIEEWSTAMADYEPLPREVRMMLHETGTLWRVDWHQVAGAFLED